MCIRLILIFGFYSFLLLLWMLILQLFKYYVLTYVMYVLWRAWNERLCCLGLCDSTYSKYSGSYECRNENCIIQKVLLFLKLLNITFTKNLLEVLLKLLRSYWVIGDDLGSANPLSSLCFSAIVFSLPVFLKRASKSTELEKSFWCLKSLLDFEQVSENCGFVQHLFKALFFHFGFLCIFA